MATPEKPTRKYPLAKFLELAPPRQHAIATPLKPLSWNRPIGRPPWAEVALPSISLHCNVCDGRRIFAPIGDEVQLEEGEANDLFVSYICRNCLRTRKTYALRITQIPSSNEVVEIVKYGEEPPFGVAVPAGVISVLDDANRSLLEKGLLSEAQGLGVGAFTYYRRLLDNQRARLFDRIITAAEKLDAEPGLIAELRRAREERQFTKAVNSVKAALPPSLYIDGHSPLTLLHDAVSDGLHADTDDACMEYAQMIRLVLVDLIRRIDSALLEQDEVKAAVTKLLQRKKAKEEQKSMPQRSTKPDEPKQ